MCHAKKSRFYPIGNTEALKNFREEENVTRCELLKRSCICGERTREDKEREPAQGWGGQLEGSYNSQEKK